MWKLTQHPELEKKLKKFRKRHKQEVVNAFDNLSDYLALLNDGWKQQQIVRGYARHREGSGVRAIDETGPKNPRKAIRLYVFPDEVSKELHVITIGDKDSQSDDVKLCQEFVASLIAEYTKSEDATDEEAKE